MTLTTSCFQGLNLLSSYHRYCYRRKRILTSNIKIWWIRQIIGMMEAVNSLKYFVKSNGKHLISTPRILSGSVKQHRWICRCTSLSLWEGSYSSTKKPNTKVRYQHECLGNNVRKRSTNLVFLSFIWAVFTIMNIICLNPQLKELRIQH